MSGSALRREREPTYWLVLAAYRSLSLIAFPAGQHDQGYPDDNERSHAQQFSAWDQIAECLLGLIWHGNTRFAPLENV
jgi:hypothetical protein